MDYKEINWNKFKKYFHWLIEDIRPVKYKREDRPYRYYACNFSESELNSYKKQHCERCMYLSKGNCTNTKNIKYKNINEIKLKECDIELEINHKKNIALYLETVIMPFGKFKGRSIKNIIEVTDKGWDNLYYLFWLWEQKWLKGDLAKALDVVRVEYNFKWSDYVASKGYCSSSDPYDTCPFSIYNEVGYGELY